MGQSQTFHKVPMCSKPLCTVLERTKALRLGTTDMVRVRAGPITGTTYMYMPAHAWGTQGTLNQLDSSSGLGVGPYH